VALGRDVCALPSPGAYPPALATITDLDLSALIRELGATTAQGSAAGDWAYFDDRMRYIAVLLRSRQQDRALRRAPEPAPTGEPCGGTGSDKEREHPPAWSAILP
jgi:hypothetical protein